MVGQNLGLPVLAAQWFFIVPPALLLSMIPISAGGWGRREGVLIFALACLGIPAGEAIAMTPQPLLCLPCFNEGDNVEPTVNFRPGESLLGLARTATGD